MANKKATAEVDPTDSRFGGLPAHHANKALEKPRTGSWYTIPREMIPPGIDMTDAECRVLITRLNVVQEDQASKLAGANLNVQATFRAKVITSIYGIGDQLAPSYDTVNDWYERIGPAARAELDGAFNEVNAASEAAAARFRKSAEPWVG